MSALPQKYAFLASEGAPKMLVEALRHYGTLEYKGADNNPDITKWAKEVGGSVSEMYLSDSIPWCGLFMAVVAKRSGKDIPKSPLWALSWATFGELTDNAVLGDVLVFVRNGGGHVGLYVGEDSKCYHVLGGNQSDAVSITRIDKKRLYSIRRPIYKTAMPPNCRKIVYAAGAKISTNEQ